MFQFPPLTSLAGSLPEGRGVAPFGYPRIKACVRLPVAFRSFTRPSSSGDAKASTIRPCVTFAYMACTASHITMTLDLCGCRHAPAAYNRSYLLISYESISFTMSKNTHSVVVRVTGRQRCLRALPALAEPYLCPTSIKSQISNHK